LNNELVAAASVTVGAVGPPLEAVAVLAEIVGELEPLAQGTSDARRRQLGARRLVATAVQAAAFVHGVFGDRPDLEVARGRVLSLLVERARALDARGSCAQALGAVATATLKLPPLHDDGHADWQVGAIAFVDERLLRALYDAHVQLAAVALREAARP
jgi:hypothetical protein